MAIIEVDQGIDLRVQEYRRSGIRVRYGYKKKLEGSQDKTYQGEDYFVVRTELERTIFVLCDGVSKSFFGNVGSQLLGELIINWLWKNFDRNSIEESKDKLTDYLNNEKLSKDIISAKEIPSTKNFLGITLERKKQQFGTQSNFVCGVIDNFGSKEGQTTISLLSLGDAKLRIFSDEENRNDLFSHDWEKNDAWSSLYGLTGDIKTYQFSVSEINTIIAHSDGLNPVELKMVPGISADKLWDCFCEAQLIKDDDISFLEIQITNENINYQDYYVPQIRSQFGKTEYEDSKAENISNQIDKKQADGSNRRPQVPKILLFGLLLISVVFNLWAISRFHLIHKERVESNLGEYFVVSTNLQASLRAVQVELTPTPNIPHTIEAAVFSTLAHMDSRESEDGSALGINQTLTVPSVESTSENIITSTTTPTSIPTPTQTP